ncbi:MAG: EAL domain-containing protein [Azoarcus sp.]|nr:EAL domain-containing protein [Azoarcus sp.]
MPIKAKRSLNRRLWLIVVLAIVPLSAIVLFDYQSQRRDAIRDIEAQIEAVMFAARQEEQSAQRSVQLVLEIVSRADNMQSLDGEDCSGLARRMLTSLPFFSNLGAAYPDGMVFCSARPMSTRVSVADRDWFREGSSGSGITRGEYVEAGRVSVQPGFVFGYPLRDADGRLLSVLYAMLRTDWFDRVIAEYNLPDGWEASLISTEGRVIASRPRIDEWKGAVPGDLMRAFRDTLQSPHGVAEAVDFRGERRLYGVEPVAIAGDDVFVAIGAPLGLSLSALDREFALRVAVLLVVALLSALVARYTIYRLVDRWAGKMLDTLDALALGRLDTRIEKFSEVRELERLERGVNRMAGQLDARTGELHKLSTAVEQSPACILITDAAARIEYVNDALVATTGYAREELVGQTPRILGGGTSAETVSDLWSTLLRGQVWRGEFHNARKDGTPYIELATVAPIRSADGRTTHYVSVGEDITLRRESEDLLHRMAYYDALTGLPNRAMLRDRLQQAALSSARTRSHAMLIHLDVDRFSELNDTLGHDAADDLLRAIAQRLRECLREDDTLARQGDDDFAAVFESLAVDEDEALAHAERIASAVHDALSGAYPIDPAGGEYHVTVSLGVTLFVGRGVAAEDLLKQAEVALYRAKEAGRDTVRFFSADMQATVETHAALVRDLREALVNGAFSLHYQPQLDGEGRMVGAEALIRWRDARGTLVPPGLFIPSAEDSGLIVPIGEWVLNTACAQLARWQAEPATRALSMAVNVSARQFHRPDFPGMVRACIERHAIDPAGLELELTESVVLGNLDEAVERMRTLRELGVRFSLDDFGTGYSSLSYLRTLPFDQIKIDQSFVRAMGEDDSSRAIVRAILAISASLSLGVVAEGVETEEQRDALNSDGCGLMQGYLFSPPVPIEALQAQPWFPSNSPST